MCRFSHDFGKPRGFAIHLATSDLVTQLVIDSDALKNEHHNDSIYDEDGDYVPQYSGDPEDLAHMGANPSQSPSVTEGNDPTPPAENTPPSETPSAD